MDNVLVDFQSGLDQVSEEVKAEYAGRLDEIPGLFAKMKPMGGPLRLCMSEKALRPVHPLYGAVEESFSVVGQGGVGDEVS